MPVIIPLAALSPPGRFIRGEKEGDVPHGGRLPKAALPAKSAPYLPYSGCGHKDLPFVGSSGDGATQALWPELRLFETAEPA